MLKDVKGDLRHLRPRGFASDSCPENCKGISSIELNKGMSLCHVSWWICELSRPHHAVVSDSRLVRGIIPDGLISSWWTNITDTYTYICTSVHTYIYVHTYIRTFKCTYRHVYVRTYLHASSCVGMCFCASIFHPDVLCPFLWIDNIPKIVFVDSQGKWMVRTALGHELRMTVVTKASFC
jgi:hypothetical protein